MEDVQCRQDLEETLFHWAWLSWLLYHSFQYSCEAILQVETGVLWKKCKNKILCSWEGYTGFKLVWATEGGAGGAIIASTSLLHLPPPPKFFYTSLLNSPPPLFRVLHSLWIMVSHTKCQSRCPSKLSVLNLNFTFKSRNVIGQNVHSKLCMAKFGQTLSDHWLAIISTLDAWPSDNGRKSAQAQHQVLFFFFKDCLVIYSKLKLSSKDYLHTKYLMTLAWQM